MVRTSPTEKIAVMLKANKGCSATNIFAQSDSVDMPCSSHTFENRGRLNLKSPPLNPMSIQYLN